MFNFSRNKKAHEDIVKELHEGFKAQNPEVEEKEVEEIPKEEQPKEVEVNEEEIKSDEQDLESLPEETEAQKLTKEKERLEKEVENKKKKEEEEEVEWQKRNPKVEQRFKKLKWEHESFKEEAELKAKETLMRLEALEKENERLRLETGKNPESKIMDEVSVKEKERINQYLNEDKNLPREKRREMPREEYEDWLAEDISAATEWKVKQALRADRERNHDINEAKATVEMENVLRKQKISRLRLEARHPELALDATKEQLKAGGMSEKEIHDKLYAEIPKYKIVYDLITGDKEFAQKVAFSPNGPEILEKEMIKHLDSIIPDKEKSEVEKLKEKIAELQEAIGLEKERQERLDVGVVSKKGAGNMEKDPKKAIDDAEVNKAISLVNKITGKPSLTKEKYLEAVNRTRK